MHPALAGALHRLRIPYTVRAHGQAYKIQPSLVDARHAWAVKRGVYEQAEFEAAHQVFDFRLPLLELGGGLGTTSCRLNPLLADPRTHTVVEASPVSAAYVAKQGARNGAGFTVVNAAVAYGPGTLRLRDRGPIRTGWSVARHHADGGREVPAHTVRDLLSTPSNVLMDIEGAEWEVLANDMPTLVSHAAGLVIDWTAGSSTGHDIQQGIQTLQEAGFDWRFQKNNVSGFVGPAASPPGARTARAPARSGGKKAGARRAEAASTAAPARNG